MAGYAGIAASCSDAEADSYGLSGEQLFDAGVIQDCIPLMNENLFPWDGIAMAPALSLQPSPHAKDAQNA